MPVKIARVTIELAVALLLTGCISTVVGTVPVVTQGPAADVEVVTSTLKKREVVWPDESVRFWVYDNKEQQVLGSELLTLEQPRKTFRMATQPEYKFMVIKVSPVMGGAYTCKAETVLTLAPGQRYRVLFDFDINYNEYRKSTCASEIQQLDSQGRVVKRIPPSSFSMSPA